LLLPGNSLGNYFTVSSTSRKIEFAHGEKIPCAEFRTWITASDFDFSLLLGSGGFGAVFKAKRKSTGINYALKVQPITAMARSAKSFGKKIEDETLIHMERTVLASCRGHPFIVSMEYAFCTHLYAVLVLEYVPGGTLSTLIANSPERRLPFSLCKIYAMEIILALHFMHRKGIIYRDLKPSNVLITLSGHLKLTDFGLAGSMLRKKSNTCITVSSKIKPSSRRLDSNLIAQMSRFRQDELTASTESSLSESSERVPEITSFEQSKDVKNGTSDVKWVRRRTVCGTAGYRPPEQVQERFLNYFSRNGYDERADWFSLGVCCYTMLTGHRPFPTKKELLLSESQRRVISKRKLPSKVVQEEVMLEKLMNDPEYRCLMFEVEYPTYFNCELEAKDFIDALLERDPESRPRYDEIMHLPWMKGETFDEKILMTRPIPEWVTNHAMMHSIEKDILQQSNKSKSLSDCVNDMCSDCYGKDNPVYAENFSVKWKSKPGQRAINLFRHWNYISDDAMNLEIRSLVDNLARRSHAVSLRSIASLSRRDTLNKIV
jgi:serine/threonine protein kinase